MVLEHWRDLRDPSRSLGSRTLCECTQSSSVTSRRWWSSKSRCDMWERGKVLKTCQSPWQRHFVGILRSFYSHSYWSFVAAFWRLSLFSHLLKAENISNQQFFRLDSDQIPAKWNVGCSRRVWYTCLISTLQWHHHPCISASLYYTTRRQPWGLKLFEYRSFRTVHKQGPCQCIWTCAFGAQYRLERSP